MQTWTYVVIARCLRCTLPGARRTGRLSGRSLFICFGLLISCFAAAQVQAAITFVQRNSATPQTPQSTVAVSYTNTQTAGNLNVVVVGWNDSTAAVSSLTDSKGTVYTRAVGPTVRSGKVSQSIYYGNTVAAAANTNTVTVQFTVPANYADIRILEYSGIDPVNRIDVTRAATGTNKSSSSGAATTTNANDLIFGANTVATSTSGPGTGFTNRIITQDGDIAEDRIVSAVGSYSASAPLTSAGAWVMQMVAFRASSGASDTTPPTAPLNLVATAAGSSAINLSWTASTDNVGVTNYLVERCQAAGCGNFVQVGTSAGTTYADTGLVPNTSYSYRTRATDAASNPSGYSNTATATTAQATAGPITFVQRNSATPQTPQSTVSVSFTNAQTGGNLNVVVVGWNDSTAAVSSLTDSKGTVYTRAVGPTVLAGQVSQSIYYGNTVAAAANTNTVTVQFTVPANYADIRILEYSGLDLVNPVDVTAAATGTSATSSSGAATTANASDLIFGANTVATSTSGPGTGFTNRIITQDGDIAEDRIVSAVGSYSASAPLTSAGAWVMQMVAFRGVANAIPSPPPDQVGQWSAPSNWPLVAVHANLLATGDVLAWDGASQKGAAFIWRPSTNTFTSKNPPDNIFCAGHGQLPDGRIFVAGGHITNFVGIPDANIFDPVTAQWTQVKSMAYGRWYPTTTALPDGRVLVVAGDIDCPSCVAAIPEIYNPANNTWAQLPGAPNPLPEYPHLFVLPDGRVLATGSFEEAIQTQVLDINAQTWTVVDPIVVDGHSSVMYRLNKFMKSGTSATSDPPFGSAASSTYVLDMTQAQPTWRDTAPMHFPRSYHNLTILPDGSVLATGGAMTTDPFDQTQAVYPAELWSPTTETWTTMASLSILRYYHSIALLLPDGRVLVAGGGRFGGTAVDDMLNAEIYSPPYLFNGTRPVITSAPSLVSYNSNFSVDTPNPGQIAKVSLLRLGAVTHHFNQDQRYLELAFQNTGNALSVTAPANADTAPPGYYMLFILNSNSVPSVASILSIN